jgi:hypothetical protein
MVGLNTESFHGVIMVKRTSPKTALFAAAFLVACFPVFGQETQKAPEAVPQYSLGDQTFTFIGGLFIPMFFLSWQPAIAFTNLSVGGEGMIEWQGYLNNNLRLGLEGGGVFAFSPNLNILWMLDIDVKLSYCLIFYPLDMAISLGAGVNMVTYANDFTIDPLIKPGFCLEWIYSSEWSFGLSVAYWWDMQFSNVPAESRIGNFTDSLIYARYHFHP